MTTKLSGGDSKVVPALGESWSHVATNRVLLFWKNGVRCANLFKSPNCKEATVPFSINKLKNIETLFLIIYRLMEFEM